MKVRVTCFVLLGIVFSSTGAHLSPCSSSEVVTTIGELSVQVSDGHEGSIQSAPSLELIFLGDGFEHSVKVDRSYSKIHGVANVLQFKNDGFEQMNVVSSKKGILFTSRASLSDVKASIRISPDGSLSGALIVNHKATTFSYEGEDSRSLKGSTTLTDTQGLKISVEYSHHHGHIHRNLQELDSIITPFFPGCYPGDIEPHELTIGVIADFSFFSRFGSTERVLDEIESFIANTNLVYASQLNMFLRLSQVIVVSEGTELPSEFDFFASCLPTPVDYLTAYRDWVRRVPSSGNAETEAVRQGAWHVLTDCYRSGNIGAAFRAIDGVNGTLCEFDSGNNAGVTSLSSREFVSFAHEVAHNFGADHSFEDGEGQTGGIMDNGSGRFNGTVQFRPQRKVEICTGLTRAKSNCDGFFRTIDSQCIDRDFCETGFCSNGECFEMDFVFEILGQTVPFQISAKEVAILLPPTTFSDPLYRTLPSEVTACEPLDSSNSATDEIIGVVLEDCLDQANCCSFLQRARNLADAGYTFAVTFSSAIASDEVISIQLEDEEIESGETGIEGLAYLYTTGAIGRISGGDTDAITSIGWRFRESERQFSSHNNLFVPDDPGLGSVLFIYIGVPAVVLTVIGILTIYLVKNVKVKAKQERGAETLEGELTLDEQITKDKKEKKTEVGPVKTAHNPELDDSGKVVNSTL